MSDTHSPIMALKHRIPPMRKQGKQMTDIEELKAALRYDFENDNVDFDNIKHAADAIEQLQRELEEARKDAERYQWLKLESNPGQLYEIARSTPSMQWDDAIDAARQG